MTEQYIGIKFAENDEELMKAIKEKFPDCVAMRSDELEGNDVFWVAVIPAAGLAVQLLDFIFTHLVKKKDKNKQDIADVESKRALIADGKAVSSEELSGMTKKQVKKTLSLKLNVSLEVGVEIRNEK